PPQRPPPPSRHESACSFPRPSVSAQPQRVPGQHRVELPGTYTLQQAPALSAAIEAGTGEQPPVGLAALLCRTAEPTRSPQSQPAEEGLRKMRPTRLKPPI